MKSIRCKRIAALILAVLLAAAQADVQAELQQEREEQEELDDTTEFAVDEQPKTIEPEELSDEEADADMDKTTVHHIEFGNLQFGRDYEIK